MTAHFDMICRGIDVSAVAAEIEAHPELWNQHSVRKTAPGTPHAAMSDIWVRYNDATPFEAGERPWAEFNDIHVPIWYEAWYALPSLQPLVWGLMAEVRGEMLGGILITKVPAGGRIDPHVDRGWHVETYDKFYLQIANPPGCKFWCDHGGVCEELEPRPGDIWLFDNRKMHGVDNDSGGERITVIICIRTELFDRKPLEEI
jgi:hypothetical protein